MSLFKLYGSFGLRGSRVQQSKFDLKLVYILSILLYLTRKQAFPLPLQEVELQRF